MNDVTTLAEAFLSRPIPRNAALSGFSYQDGYTLSATDLGTKGVKVELRHSCDSTGAIILPPNQAQEYGKWLLDTLGQDHFGLPKELPDILERICRQKGPDGMFQRGDKKAIKSALKVLKSGR